MTAYPIKPLFARRIGSALFAAALILLPADRAFADSSGGDTSIDVMTFNIRFDGNTGASTGQPNSWIRDDGQHRRDLVVSVINDFGPDLLGMQEALANQVADLSAALPGYGFYGVGRNDGVSAGEHSGIYFRADRFTATDQGTFWLSNTPEVVGSVYPGAATVRIASWVKLADGATGETLFVLNTHWDHVSQAAREHGAGLIRDHLDGLPDDLPLIVMGDLNVNEDNAAFQALINASAQPGSRPLVDSYRTAHPARGIMEGTFNAFSGASFGARIDHILHTNDFATTDAAIVRTEFNGRYASDHYPVIATLVAALAGDYNSNGRVEQGDLDLVLRNWGTDTGVAGIPAGWTGDNKYLGQIDQTELDRVLTHWGGVSAPDFREFEVPEPGTAALMGASAAMVRRR